MKNNYINVPATDQTQKANQPMTDKQQFLSVIRVRFQQLEEQSTLWRDFDPFATPYDIDPYLDLKGDGVTCLHVQRFNVADFNLTTDKIFTIANRLGFFVKIDEGSKQIQLAIPHQTFEQHRSTAQAMFADHQIRITTHVEEEKVKAKQACLQALNQSTKTSGDEIEIRIDESHFSQPFAYEVDKIMLTHGFPIVHILTSGS